MNQVVNKHLFQMKSDREKEREKKSRIKMAFRTHLVAKHGKNDEKSLSVFKMTYNKAKDGHVKHSQRINKISLSLERKRWNA